MTQLSTQTGLRVLVLDPDKASVMLLHNLLQLITETPCNVTAHQPGIDILPADATAYALCFVADDYLPDDLHEVVSRLNGTGIGPRIICLLSESNLHGNRQETARLVRAGVYQFLAREELSVRVLRQILADLSPAAIINTPDLAPLHDERNKLSGDAGGHWEMDLQGRQARFDSHTMQRLGYQPEQIGTTLGDWKALIHPDDIDRLIRELNQVLEGNAPPHQVSYRICEADGSWTAAVSDDINVQLNESGIATVIQGTFYWQDAGLHEREPTELTTDSEASTISSAHEPAVLEPEPREPEPREPEEDTDFWKRVVESLPNVVLILDENGIVEQLVVGDPAELGLPGDTLVGQPVSMLLGEQAGMEFSVELTRTLNTGKQARFNCRTAGTGDTQWLECRISVLKTQPGRPRFAVWTATNTSERTAAMADMSATRQQFRDALYRVPAAFYLKDTEGRYLLVNPHFEALYGIEEEAIVGKTDYEIFSDELATELFASDRQVIDTFEPYEQLVSIGAGDRRRRYRRFGFPVCDSAGDLTGVCSLSIAQDRFATVGNTSAGPTGLHFDHELSEITAALVARAERCVIESVDCDNVFEQLQEVARATSQAQNLVRPFTDSQAEQALVMMPALPVLANTLELVEVLLPEQVQLKRDIAEQVPDIHANPALFQQLLTRTIRHARGELGEQGVLSIKLHPKRLSPRGCASCMELVDGDYIELVIEESASEPSEPDLQQMFSYSNSAGSSDDRRKNLVEIHRLVHSIGGHLLVQRGVPTGSSIYLLLRSQADTKHDIGRSTVTRLPVGKQTRD